MSVGAQAKWDILIQRLREWMVKKRTAPALQLHILASLQKWRKQENQPIRRGTADIRTAFEEQDEIGWWNFLLGRMSKKLAAYQDKHYKSIGRRATGKVWLRGIIQQMIDICWGMWEHRNHVLHETETDRDRAELANLRRTVKEEFRKGRSGLFKQDCHKLQHREWVLEQGLEFLRTWIDDIQLARLAYSRVQDAA